jgi:site-specific DNA-methyltransferase (adenine-specific)
MNTKLMFSSADQTWETPIDFFKKVNDEFNFTIDVCATSLTAKCKNYFTVEDNALVQNWRGVCWMNPPYGRDIKKWIKKAYEESKLGAKVVCLIPARTDTTYWHNFIFPYASEIRFIKGRLKFGNSTNSAPFPSALIVFDSNKSKQVVSTY